MVYTLKRGHRDSKKRHRCSTCGRTRYEYLLATTGRKTRYGHQIWFCWIKCRGEGRGFPVRFYDAPYPY